MDGLLYCNSFSIDRFPNEELGLTEFFVFKLYVDTASEIALEEGER